MEETLSSQVVIVSFGGSAVTEQGSKTLQQQLCVSVTSKVLVGRAWLPFSRPPVLLVRPTSVSAEARGAEAACPKLPSL